ncbi:hypothetical protein [Amycolatopsis sp. NPDC021455]|uniref:hypothetical protein n=1 Tax=Amycolatopsis sp. NPDC021455 TaxID=3154901 RepID=UPI0033EC3882
MSDIASARLPRPVPSLGEALNEVLARQRERALSPDPAYTDAIERVYRSVLAWTRSGLGSGRAHWRENAGRTVLADDPEAPTRAEFERVHFEVDRRYTELDSFFRQRLDTIFADVAAALRGELPRDGTGREALERLARTAGPYPAARNALAEFLALRLDYRTQIHPRIRPALDAPDPRALVRTRTAARPGPDGTAELFLVVTESAERAAYHIRTQLLENSLLPDQIVFAAVERLTGELTHSAEEWVTAKIS